MDVRRQLSIKAQADPAPGGLLYGASGCLPVREHAVCIQDKTGGAAVIFGHGHNGTGQGRLRFFREQLIEMVRGGGRQQAKSGVRDPGQDKGKEKRKDCGRPLAQEKSQGEEQQGVKEQGIEGCGLRGRQGRPG